MPGAAPEVGSTILHYRILRAIGRGGMGVVYEAEDTRLGRRVALKFLPPELARDAPALERFQREARAASALNHPNICTVHAIEQWDGGHFIVMELLDGEPIDRRIGARPLAWDAIIEIGTQVADALAAAHQRGIVHRDIKPANILVTRDGRAKVLDFGVAKFASSGESETIGAATAAAKLTGAGTAVGTIAYMSPEQARGEEIDARSDLFSLAAVLYEIATARPAFAGQTTAVIFQQILGEDSPRPRELNPALPAKLEEIIVKGLEKDRDLRYQTAAELRGDLRRLKRDASSGRIEIPEASVTSGVRSPSSGAVVLHEAKRHKPIAALLTVLVVAILAAAAYGVRALIVGTPLPELRTGSRMTLTNITTHGDAQGCGAITPDGKYVAYCTFAGELRVTQVATGATVVLGNYRGVSTFSPDGDYLFLQTETDEHPGGVLWMLPTLGGPPRRVVTDIVGAPAVSPDGSRIAFVRPLRDERVTTVILADADGSNERRLMMTTRESWLDYPGLSWSQDGRFLAGVLTSATGAGMRPVVIHVDSGKIDIVGTRVWPAVGRTAWLPGNAILFSAPERPNGTYQFWTMAYPGGEASRVTSDARGFGNISVSPTAAGNAIATIPVELVSTLWETNADASAAPVQWTSGRREDGVGDIRSLPNGAVVYRSWDGTDEGVWSVDRAGASPRKLTRMSAGPPAVPADGRFVVFATRGDGRAGIWRMEPDGSGARAIASHEQAAGPLVTPDGKWVYFATQTGIMRVPADGGEPSRLHDLAYPLDISPDGRHLLVVLPNPEELVQSLAVIDGESGKVVKKVPDIPGQIWTARYGRRADLVAYIAAEGNVTNLWEQPIDGGERRQLTRFTEGEIFGFGYSADRTRLFLGRGRRSGDVVLIKDFQ